MLPEGQPAQILCWPILAVGLSLVFLNITTIPLLSIAQKEPTLPPSHPLAYHNKIPHPGSLGYKCGHRTAAWHEDDLDGVVVEQFIQVLGGLPWVTLKEGGGMKLAPRPPPPHRHTHLAMPTVLDNLAPFSVTHFHHFHHLLLPLRFLVFPLVFHLEP